MTVKSIFECSECMEELDMEKFHSKYDHYIFVKACICKECHNNLDGPSDEFYEEFYERNFLHQEMEYKRNYVHKYE